MVSAVAVMNKLIFAFMSLIGTSTALAVPGRVGYIIDGDTFACVVNLAQDIDVSVRVRIRNVDTPEIHGDCEYERSMALRAKNRLEQLIPVGTVVELSNVKDDKYLGRIDANVADATGRDVGDILIHEKLGRPYSGGHRNPWCK